MLPDELYHYIFSFCNYKSIFCLEQSCNKFKTIIHDEYFRIDNITFSHYKQKKLFYYNFKKQISSDNYKKIKLNETKNGIDNINIELFDNAFSTKICTHSHIHIANLYDFDASHKKGVSVYGATFISETCYNTFLDNKMKIYNADNNTKILEFDDYPKPCFSFFDANYIYVYCLDNEIEIIKKYDITGNEINSKQLKIIEGNVNDAFYGYRFHYNKNFLMVYKNYFIEPYIDIIDLKTMEIIYNKKIYLDTKINTYFGCGNGFTPQGSYRPIFKYPYIIEWDKHEVINQKYLYWYPWVEYYLCS